MAATTATMRPRKVAAQSRALPLADEIDRLRAAVEGCKDRSRRSDLRWALADRARIVRDNLDALETAIALAEEGDEEAIEALRLADQLPCSEAPPRTSVEGTEERLAHMVCELDLGDLVQLLAAMRRNGVSFPVAWMRATVALGLDCGEDAAALAATRDGWKAAYLRERGPGLGLSSWYEEEPRGRSGTSETGAMIGV